MGKRPHSHLKKIPVSTKSSKQLCREVRMDDTLESQEMLSTLQESEEADVDF